MNISLLQLLEWRKPSRLPSKKPTAKWRTNVYELNSTRKYFKEGTLLCKLLSDPLNVYISSGARHDDVNARTILPGNPHSVRRMRLKYGHILVWFSTYRQFVICRFYFSKFHTKRDFVFKNHGRQILFTMLMRISIHGSFIVHALLPGTSKAFTLSVFLKGRVHILLPGTQQFGELIPPVLSGPGCINIMTKF